MKNYISSLKSVFVVFLLVSVCSLSAGSWSSLTDGSGNNGLNGNVYALALNGGELYAGGTFSASGSTTINRIGKWNGTGWSQVGQGITSGNIVNALATGDGFVYVGGDFTSLDGFGSAARIARWDPSTSSSPWATLGSGVDNYRDRGQRQPSLRGRQLHERRGRCG